MFSYFCLDCPAYEFGGCHSDCVHFCPNQFAGLCSSCRYNPVLDVSRLPFTSNVFHNPFSDPDMCLGCSVLYYGSDGFVWCPSNYVSLSSNDFEFVDFLVKDCSESIDMSKPDVYLDNGDLDSDCLPF